MAAPPPPGSLPPPFDVASSATLAPTEQPNPDYRRLFQSYADAYNSIDRLRQALDPAMKTMGGTDAWLGPEARAWNGRLESARGDLRKAADQILWDIYDRLSATRRTIPRV
ncbi:hypothetical protein [Actinomadura parmotrematis]|uniref:WXG100 family type VII secretion target n=1 Tax=Actinomadura parmotrematis TaxID=2864039 RepID=A0ABS7FKM2_9ACTN|nr:hypothetical protein [Actinomadura parmotrematis]MBW8480906.1 hypothetical protein [Actinomadura parmotrematis]